MKLLSLFTVKFTSPNYLLHQHYNIIYSCGTYCAIQSKCNQHEKEYSRKEWTAWQLSENFWIDLKHKSWACGVNELIIQALLTLCRLAIAAKCMHINSFKHSYNIFSEVNFTVRIRFVKYVSSCKTTYWMYTLLRHSDEDCNLQT